jgi:hypothetical protein
LVFLGFRTAVQIGGQAALTSGLQSNFGLPFAGLLTTVGGVVRSLPTPISLLWCGGLVGLIAMMIWTARAMGGRSTAPAHERLAWVLALLVVVLASKNIWRDFNDFRVFVDAWVLGAVILLQSNRRLLWPGILCAAAWIGVAWYYAVVL